MAQTVTPWQIDFGFKTFYRCDTCFMNVIENYQWMGFAKLPVNTQQNEYKCPYCKAEISFDLSSIDIPTTETPAIKKFETGEEQFVFKTDQTILTQVKLTLRGTAGKVVTVHWGDSNKEDIVMTGANVLTTHDYTVQKNYYIKIFCDSNIISYVYMPASRIYGTLPTFTTQANIERVLFQTNLLSSDLAPFGNLNSLVFFYCNNNNLSGNFPSINTLTSLRYLRGYDCNFSGNLPSPSSNASLSVYYMYNCNFSGSIPSLSSNLNIIYFFVQNNNLTGTIPSFATNVSMLRFRVDGNSLTGTTPDLSLNIKLQGFYFHNNQISNYTASTLALTLIFFYGTNNLLPSSAVNQILADFVLNLGARPVAGNIWIHGVGNGPPTGQGLLDKAAIIAHGWNVLTN